MGKVRLLDKSFGKYETYGHSYTLNENEIKAVRPTAFINRFDIAFRNDQPQDIDEDIATALTKKFPHIKIIDANRESVDGFLDTLKDFKRNQVMQVLASHNKCAKEKGIKLETLEGTREMLITKIAKLRSIGVKLPEELQDEKKDLKDIIDPVQQKEAERRIELFKSRREALLAAGMEKYDTIACREEIIAMTEEEFTLYKDAMPRVLKLKKVPYYKRTQAEICDLIMIETYGKETELREGDAELLQKRIQEAIDRGDEIPEDVLAEYPDLKIRKSESLTEEAVTPGEEKKPPLIPPSEGGQIRVVDDDYTVKQLDELVEKSNFEIKPGLNKAEKIAAINVLLLADAEKEKESPSAKATGDREEK